VKHLSFIITFQQLQFD